MSLLSFVLSNTNYLVIYPSFDVELVFLHCKSFERIFILYAEDQFDIYTYLSMSLPIIHLELHIVVPSIK